MEILWNIQVTTGMGALVFFRLFGETQQRISLGRHLWGPRLFLISQQHVAFAIAQNHCGLCQWVSLSAWRCFDTGPSLVRVCVVKCALNASIYLSIGCVYVCVCKVCKYNHTHIMKFYPGFIYQRPFIGGTERKVFRSTETIRALSVKFSLSLHSPLLRRGSDDGRD